MSILFIHNCFKSPHPSQQPKQLRRIPAPRFAQDRAAVGVHRVLAEEEVFGDVGAGFAFENAAGDFDLTAGEAHVEELVEVFDLATALLAEALEGGAEFIRVYGLEEVVQGFLPQGFDGVALVGGGEDHGRGVALLTERLQQTDAVEFRHVHIEKYELVIALKNAFAGLERTVFHRYILFSRAADHQQLAQTLARQRVVVDNEIHDSNIVYRSRFHYFQIQNTH